ncbi:MAG: CoA ester lyase [Candidatus Eremiobacteraeota bacterium]|nr:CoA ester lyase [Candidatus Eremiobacteraeota bacterium]
MEKTLEVDTDAVILDLEDAVATAEKPAARGSILEWLKRPRGHRLAYVRVNGLGTPFSFADFNAVVVQGLDGILLPKVESPVDLAIADYMISSLENARGIAAGTVDLMPIIETAKGAENMQALARATPRVKRLCFGSGDYTNDTGTAWTLDNPLTLIYRAQLANASRSAGIEPPLDTVWPHLEDESGLIAESQQARAMGYQGKMAIHPKQLEIINKTFSPSPAEVAFAKKICDAFDAAERSGSSALVVDGVFVDYPVVYRARAVLANAERMGIVG